MAVSDSFLATCRLAVQALPELTAFKSALAALEQADDGAQQARWRAAYSDAQSGASPAYRLRFAIRGVIGNNATVDHSNQDRELAYRTLAAEVCPERQQPMTPDQELLAAQYLFFLNQGEDGA